MADHQQALRGLFISGVKNAHAVEKQALSIMEPQIARIANSPEVADRLRLHVDETNQQIARLDEILAALNSGNSAIKEAALGISGSMAAMVHSVAADEILKNGFANHAFEHFEIAAYTSLPTLAESGGFSAAPPLLRRSLDEEKAMAIWIGETLPVVTRRYRTLYADGGSGEAKI